MTSDRLPALVLAVAVTVAGTIAYRAFTDHDDAGRRFAFEDYRSMPASFDSIEAARQWARGNVTGGRVDHLSVPGPDVMVVFQHGSGVPVVQIGVYQRRGFDWKLVATPAPPSGLPVEHLRATAAGRHIFVRGLRTNLSAPLVDLS